MRPEHLGLLSDSLAELARRGSSEVRVLSATSLREGVHRLRLEGATRDTVVVKRLGTRRSDLERRLTDRWLPGVGMDGLGPPRFAMVAEHDGRHVWHVYDDLGPGSLDREDVAEDRILAAMDRLAELHTSFAGHSLLAEPRFAAGDLGAWFYVNSVRDAARCVALLRPPEVRMSASERRARDAVQHLLSRLLEDEPRRVRLLSTAGPETLVHGDLTRANVFVGSAPEGLRACFIDWDHVGVAPAGFDISTHVAHYPPGLRKHVLDHYTRAMAQRGSPFADGLDWPLLMVTFEAGRLANQIIWIAQSILEGSRWGFQQLAWWSRALGATVAASGDGGPG